MKTYSRKKPGDSPEIILHLNELCRLCMTKEDVLVPIFNDDEPVPLTLRIMACAQLAVYEGDGLPDKICHPCRFQLEKSYTFRKKCEQSDSKLRQHLLVLQEKLGSDAELMETDEVENDSERDKPEESEEVKEASATEEDLVGVTQVAFIEPTHEATEENATENITLPIEGLNKDACTLVTQIQMKKEDAIEIIAEGDDNSMEVPQEYILGENVHVLEEAEPDVVSNIGGLDDPELEAIADAVKATLASHPNLNISGELQMKVDTQPGKPTQVQVTTEDGSVVVMELMTEEDTNEVSPVNEDGELKIFQCPDCPKSFARRIQLRRHASVHMQQRGYSCGICEKWFPTRSALVRHERIHTGERPFQCEVCQKSFAQKEILFRHLMTHTGQKPYNCPHCPKGFTQKEPLKAHLRTHMNPGPNDIQLHYCTLCPKVFCHASGLSRHLVTHTGKTFKCRDCDKSFTDKSSLRRHHKHASHQE